MASGASLADRLPGDNSLSGDLPGEILLGLSFLLVFEGVIVVECKFSLCFDVCELVAVDGKMSKARLLLLKLMALR